VPTVLFPQQFGLEHATDNGGLKLNDVPVYLIYWSESWQTEMGPGIPGSGQITAAIQDLISGPYFNGLLQYGVNGKAHIVNHIVNLSTPSNPFSDGVFSSNLRSAVLDVGEPDADSLSRMPVFVVVTPPGVKSEKGGAGYNEMQFNVDTIFDIDAVPIIWLGGITPNGLPPGSSMLDTYTDNFSHEMAEAITDIGNGSIGFGSGITVTKGSRFNLWQGDNQIADNEAQLYTYRLQGHLVQSYWSEHDQAYIVPDGNTQVVSVANGTLTVNDDQLASHDDTIVIDQLVDGETQVKLNNEVFQFDPGRFRKIQVNCHTGRDEVDVNGLDPNIGLTVQAGSGTCLVNVGGSPLVNLFTGSQNLSRVKGPVTVNGNGAGTTVDVVDDHADVSPTYEIGAGTVQRNGSALITYSGVSALTVRGGNLSHFHVNAVNVPTTLHAGFGTVTIDVCPSSQNLDNIGSSLTVQGNGTATTLNLNDQGTSAATTYTIDAGQVTRTRMGSIAYAYSGLTALNLAGGPVQNSFVVVGTSVPTTLTAGAGANDVSVSPTVGNTVGSLASLLGPLTVQGGGLSTSLELNDAAEPANLTYTILASSVERPGIPDVSYSNLTSLRLTGGTGTNTVNIEQLSAATTFNAGSGLATVYVAPTAQDLDAIGNLTVTGANSLVVDDQANPNPPGWGAFITTTYTLYGDTLIRTVNFLNILTGETTSRVSTISYAAGNLTVNTGHTTNVVKIEGTSAVTIWNGGGDHGDAVTVGPFLDDIRGALTVKAHGGSLILNDQGTSDVDSDDYTLTNNVTWNVTGGAVTRSNSIHEVDVPPVDWPRNLPRPKRRVVNTTTSQTISYSNAASLTIDGAAVQNTYKILSTGAGTPVTVQAGVGTNRYALGQAGLVKAIRSTVSLTGAGLDNALTVDDSQSTSRDQLTIANGKIGAVATDAFFGAGGSLSFSGLSAVALKLSNANDDAVQLMPDPMTPFTLNGSLAAYQAGHGARLTLNRTGVTTPMNQVTAPGSGRWTFGNRQPVSYTNFAATM
jgi:hypothetical protein